MENMDFGYPGHGGFVIIFLFSCKESEIPIVSGQNQCFFNGAIPVGNTRVWCLVEAHAILAHLATQSSLLNGTQGTLTGTSEISPFLGDLPNPVSSCFMTMYYELVSSSSSPEDIMKNVVNPMPYTLPNRESMKF